MKVKVLKSTTLACNVLVLVRAALVLASDFERQWLVRLGQANPSFVSSWTLPGELKYCCHLLALLTLVNCFHKFKIQSQCLNV